ncbi:MAG: hypothetical protein ABI539_13360 [Acidobacteriota bacterium]
MKKSIPFLFLLFTVLGCVNARKADEGRPSKQNPSIFESEKQGALQKQILDKIGKFPEKWESVDFSKWEKNAVTVYLNYRTMPGSMLEVELGTKIIAKATLDVLVANGYDPKKEWLALFVHAQMREKGATGSNMTRRFGKVMYDFNTDSLEFKPIK